MTLDSVENVELLRICTLVKMIELEKNRNNPEFTYNNELRSLYSNLFETLKNYNIKDVNIILNQLAQFSDFSEHIFNDTPQSIAEKYLGVAEDVLTDEQFNKVKHMFSSYITHPNNNKSTNSSDRTILAYLKQLQTLFKSGYSKKLSASQFKEFSRNFRDLSMCIGECKLEQAFNRNNQTISDMQISYDASDVSKPLYKIDLDLLDRSSKRSHTQLVEKASTSGFISTYPQNLCYSYLEANKYSQSSDELLTEEIIARKMSIFRDCSKNLEAMANCQLNILNNSIKVSVQMSTEPSKELPHQEAVPASVPSREELI